MTEKRLAAGQTSELNKLPDSAFAVVLTGGKLGDDGRTSPLALRQFAHHDASGKVDTERVAAALAEIEASDLGAEDAGRATAHLAAHKAEHKEAKAKATGAERRSTAGIESRIISSDVRLTHRTAEDGSGTATPVFEGYTALFNSRTQIGPPEWGFREQIAPGAFKRTLAANDAVALFNHNPDLLLARTSAGTATAREDEHGLWVSADLADDELGRSVAMHTARGDLKGQSFSFLVNGPAGERWETLPDGSELRTLLDVDLFDFGPVTFPAYASTTASMRSAEHAVEVARRNHPVAPASDVDASTRQQLDAEALDATENRAEWEAELAGHRAAWLDLGRDLY